MSTIPTFDVRALSGSTGSAAASSSQRAAAGAAPGGRAAIAPHAGPHFMGSALAAGFREYGFVALVGHEIGEARIEAAYSAVRRFFALPDPVKRRYWRAGAGGARGYTPFRTERAKDQSAPDLKEFWHVGRELAASERAHPGLLPNVWPEEVPELEPSLLALYRALDALGARVLSALALDLALPARWFDDKIDRGNSILRALHYPPLRQAAVPARQAGARGLGGPGPSSPERDAGAASPSPDAVDGELGVRAAAHEDINLITLMVAADEPGLEILRRDGTWLAVEVPPDQVIVNIGDMLQRLTNHMLPSTTHRVGNPNRAWRARSRYALPFFLHLNPEFSIATLASCRGPNCPDRYPEPITADDYLRQRLREIGLL